MMAISNKLAPEPHENENASRLQALRARGVRILRPDSIEIGGEVDLHRLAAGATIHAGCRIRGETTSIGPGATVGAEAPVTLENCQLGRDVELKGGFFSGATFLDKAKMGSSAHIRKGTILEEQASGAHAVGLKQTLLFPFVTLGSLINFCDILMAGGTSRKNHSEVGSSYVHFNFTPHQDKATPSLVGDVPSGVMLDQPPIFLGGQAGLVGPCRLAFGSVVAAGTVCRRDLLEGEQLYIPESLDGKQAPYRQGVYRHIGRIVTNNLHYIGNTIALRAWYEVVRQRFMRRDQFDLACHQGAIGNLEFILAERLKRMRDLTTKMEYSIERLNHSDADYSACIAEQERLVCLWPRIEEQIVADRESGVDFDSRDLLASELDSLSSDNTPLEALRALSEKGKAAGTAWLQSIVSQTVDLWESND